MPHGKLIIIDEARAVLGSMAMSALSLDFRREVSIVIDDAADRARAERLLRGSQRARRRRRSVRLPGDRAA